MKTQYSQLDFHHGEALHRVAAQYATLLEVIFEAVQNALDAEATLIHITINQRLRSIVVNDDGVGTSRQQFEEALLSVCRSVKDASKLGQFGMGLIAPLGKCDRFTFTSTPKTNGAAYTQWAFESEEIRVQERVQGIPMVPRPDLRFSRTGQRGSVPWRTQVRIEKYTRDRYLSRMTTDSLREGLLERFSATMRRLKTAIDVKIVNPKGGSESDHVVAEQYTGRRLPQEKFAERSCGETIFRLYVANKTARGRRGKVVIGQAHKDFRISFREFCKNTPDCPLEHRVVEALTSGIFEGEILSTGAQLEANRKQFVMNDALFDLCITIERWYKEIGESETERIQEESQDNRYQELGLKSMRVIEALLDQPQFEHLKKVLKTVRVGSIGEHHAESKGKVLGREEVRSLSTTGGSGKPKTGSSFGGFPPAINDRANHMPFTVAGQKGRQRIKVRGESQGLQFLYEEMEGSDRLWTFDGITGELRFNIRHPLWANCEENEKALMRFQEYIAIQALTLETVPPDWKERHRMIIDDSMPSFVFLLLEGDVLAGRKSGKKAPSRR